MAQQGKKTNFTQEQVLLAIKNCRGLMTSVARKLDVSAHTAKKWVLRWEKTRMEFLSEEQRILDESLSLIYSDILKNNNVETAKWFVAMKLRQHEINRSSEYEEPEEEEVTVKQVYNLGDGVIVEFPE